MTCFRAVTLFAILAALPVPRVAQTQDAARLTEQGVSAYRALQHQEAADLFNAAIRAARTRNFADTTIARAFVYLGATHVLLGKRDSATIAFRGALRVRPRMRADTLIFPPEITNAFEVVRLNTAYVTVAAARDTTIVPGSQRYVIKLHASAPHAVEVDLRSSARRVRLLHSGYMGDSLVVSWDGTDETGAFPRDSILTLRVAATDSRDEDEPTTMRMRVRVWRQELLPLPAPPDTSGARRASVPTSGAPVSALAIGFAGGAAAIVLPAAVAGGDDAWSARYAVGGVIGAAGVISFISQMMKRERGLETNDARDAAVQRWRSQHASVSAENDRRRRAVRMRITTESAPRAGGT